MEAPRNEPAPTRPCGSATESLEALEVDAQGHARSWQAVGAPLDANPQPSTPQAGLVLAVGPDAQPVVSWTELGEGNTRTRHVQRWKTGGWESLRGPPVPTRYSVSLFPGRPKLVVAPDGAPIFTQVHDLRLHNSVVEVWRWNGVSWSLLPWLRFHDAEPLSGRAEVLDPTLAFDCAGSLWAAWSEVASPTEGGTAFDVHVARWTGSAWGKVGSPLHAFGESPSRWPGSHALYPSLAIDRTGAPIVAWTESPMDDVLTNRAFVRRWTPGGWESLGDVASDPAQGSVLLPSLALQNGETPFLALHQWRYRADLQRTEERHQTRRWTGRSWETTTEGDIGWWPVVAARGPRVFMAFLRDDQLHVLHWEDGRWRPLGAPLQALSGETRMTDFALEVDPRGLPVVSWIEYSRNPWEPGYGAEGDPGESRVYVRRWR